MAVAAGATLPEPYASLYHDTADVLAEFSALAARHADVMSWSPSVEGNTTVSLGVARFSAGGAGVPTVLYVFGEHARELISSEVALWFARVLVGEASALETWPQAAAAMATTRLLRGIPPALAGLSLQAWARALLAHVTLVIVPVEARHALRVPTGICVFG